MWNLLLMMTMAVKGYELGATTGQCRKGFWKVSNYHECRRVVEFKHLVVGKYKGYYTSADEPSGCNKKLSNGEIMFNNHETGTNVPGFQPVCVERPPPAIIGVKNTNVCPTDMNSAPIMSETHCEAIAHTLNFEWRPAYPPLENEYLPQGCSVKYTDKHVHFEADPPGGRDMYHQPICGVVCEPIQCLKDGVADPTCCAVPPGSSSFGGAGGCSTGFSYVAEGTDECTGGLTKTCCVRTAEACSSFSIEGSCPDRCFWNDKNFSCTDCPAHRWNAATTTCDLEDCELGAAECDISDRCKLRTDVYPNICVKCEVEDGCPCMADGSCMCLSVSKEDDCSGLQPAGRCSWNRESKECFETVATCGTYPCTTVFQSCYKDDPTNCRSIPWVKKQTALIETLANPSEATCCEAPCGVAGKPDCFDYFDVNQPQANAKQKTSSGRFSAASDDSSTSSSSLDSKGSDSATGSGTSFRSGTSSSLDSNGSNKHLLWLLLLIPLLCCLIPLLLWLCCLGAKKPKKKAAPPLLKEQEADPVPLLVSGAIPQYSYAPVVTTPMTTGVLYPMSVPQATVGIDTIGDGRANLNVRGVDMNRDGIPDFLQSPRMQFGSQVVASPVPSLGLTVSPRPSNPAYAGYSVSNPALSPRLSPR